MARGQDGKREILAQNNPGQFWHGGNVNVSKNSAFDLPGEIDGQGGINRHHALVLPDDAGRVRIRRGEELERVVPVDVVVELAAA